MLMNILFWLGCLLSMLSAGVACDGIRYNVTMEDSKLVKVFKVY